MERRANSSQTLPCSSLTPYSFFLHILFLIINVCCTWQVGLYIFVSIVMRDVGWNLEGWKWKNWVKCHRTEHLEEKNVHKLFSSFVTLAICFIDERTRVLNKIQIIISRRKKSVIFTCLSLNLLFKRARMYKLYLSITKNKNFILLLGFHVFCLSWLLVTHIQQRHNITTNQNLFMAAHLPDW